MGIEAAIIGGSVISGVMGNKAASKQASASNYATNASLAEQARQFDLTRQDTAPYREAGVNALNQLQGNLQYTGASLPTFQYDQSLPQFQGGDRFSFNLEADPGYQFARDEAIKATNRAAAGQGQSNSGNRLAAIADRVTGIASQYANDAFNRQYQTSNTNYGRDVGEYQMGYNRENDLYGRALTGYGLNYQQNQDTYGRQQDYLNRLAAISGLGQTGVSQAGQAGANLATGTTNALFANAQNQANAANTQYGSINNAIQGGTQNWLLNNYLQNSTAMTPNQVISSYGYGY